MAVKTMVDSSSAAQFKFERIGQTLKGYLVASEEFPLNGKLVKKHIFKNEKGLVGVLGSKNLNDKIATLISQFGLGLWVEATYSSSMKTKQPQPMKVFTVAYDEDNREEGGISSQSFPSEETDYVPAEDELAEPDMEEESALSSAKTSGAPTRVTNNPVQVNKEAQARVQSVLNRRTPPR